MKWLTDQYDRLYKQVKEEGKDIVCRVDFRVIGGIVRDNASICCFNHAKNIKIYTRGHTYADTDQYPGLDEELRFIRMCEKKQVQWLDESEDHLKESALRICATLHRKHRSTFKYLDVANEDKVAVLHHFGISAGGSEINIP